MSRKQERIGAMEHIPATAGLAIVMAAGLLPTSPAARGATIFWDGNGADTNWNTTANWSTSATPDTGSPTPGLGDELRFGAGTTTVPFNGNRTSTVDGSNPRTTGFINFLAGTSGANNGGNWTIEGNALSFGNASNQINVQGAASPASRTITFNNDIVLATQATTFATTGSTSNLVFNGVLSGNGVNVALQSTVSSGFSTQLNNANTYTGNTTVTRGNVTIGALGSLASANVLVVPTSTSVGNSSLLILSNNASLDDVAALTLTPNGAATAKVNLNFTAGLEEAIGSLVLNGVSQPFGTYGATGSGADFVDDTYFTGTGLLRVVPEPAGLAGLGLGALGLLRRRRARSTTP